MRSNMQQINKEKIIPSGDLGSAPANMALYETAILVTN